MLINRMSLKIFYHHSVAFYSTLKSAILLTVRSIIIMKPYSDFGKKYFSEISKL